MKEVRHKTRQFIHDEFIYEEGVEIRDDMSLRDQEILDSLGTVLLIEFLEEQFDIQISDHEVVTNNLGSIDAIVAFVRRKMGKPKPLVFA